MDLVAVMFQHVKSRRSELPTCTGDWGSCECQGCQDEREQHWGELAMEDARMERGR